MTQRIRVSRSVRLPDEAQVERCLRAPELGPKILFFSGGSALRDLSRILKRYTHNSIHLITPFDSGGSSASLRQAFDMLSVGDLRNRLMALADESALGNPAIYRLFSHRFPSEASPTALRKRLAAMIDGKDLVEPIPTPMRRIIRTHLRLFAESAPPEFDLRSASVGNLILAGGNRLNEGDMDSVIYLFSKLVSVRGTVLPIVDTNLHLASELQDGRVVVGQHRFTGKCTSPLSQPIQRIWLCPSLDDPTPTSTALHSKVERLIDTADLIVFPMGSFWSSLMANLLPKGVGRAIAAAQCPKVFVPSTGVDPEVVATSITDCVEYLLALLRNDVGSQVPTDRLLNAIVLDSNERSYRCLDVPRLETLNVPIASLPLITESNRLDPTRLAHVLLSLA